MESRRSLHKTQVQRKYKFYFYTDISLSRVSIPDNERNSFTLRYSLTHKLQATLHIPDRLKKPWKKNFCTRIEK